MLTSRLHSWSQKRSERGPEKRSALPCSQHRCSQQVRDGGSPCHLTGERIKRGPPTQGKTAAVVQLLSRVRLFVTPWAAAHQASLSITNSQNLLKLMPIGSVMPSSHLILCRPLLLPPCLQSFPASGSFPRSQFFASDGQILEFQLQHQSFQ